MRRLVASFAVACGLLLGALPQPAGAVVAYRNVGTHGSQVKVQNWGTSTTSPPRGRAATCAVVNKGDIYYVRTSVTFLSNGVRTTTGQVTLYNPAPGQCATADDYEWAYPGRSFLKADHWAYGLAGSYHWTSYLWSVT